MKITIDEMISFCEEEERNHRISCKRYDDASGYTRSKDKNIRTAVAIREEIYGNCYKQIADIMRKYQKIVPALVDYDLLNPIADVKTIDGEGTYINLSDLQDYIAEVLENGNDD